MNAADRKLCITTACFIGGYQVFAALGLVCTTLGLLTVFGIGGMATQSNAQLAVIVIVLVLGLWERYLALRLRFDAGLFGEMGRDNGLSLAELDTTLQKLRLRASPRKVRDLPTRIKGALRLFWLHVVCTALQVILLLAAACM